MFLDSRWQGSAGSSGGPATDDKNPLPVTPTRSCATGWSGPLGIFLSILVQLSGLLCLFSIFSSASNALPSDLEILQHFLLQELHGLQ